MGVKWELNGCGSAVPHSCTLYLRIMCKRRAHHFIKNFGLDIQDYGGCGLTIIVTKRGNVFRMDIHKPLSSLVNIEEYIIGKIKHEEWGKIKSKFAM